MKEKIKKLKEEQKKKKIIASNRDIFISNLTILEAEKIHNQIKLYNELDEYNSKLIAERQPIKIYINSLGGSLDALFLILDSIKLSKTPVYTINIGTAQKESFFIFLAGDLRYSYPNATFLFQKDLALIDESNEAEKNIYEKQITFLKELFLDKTRVNENEYNKKAKNKGTWFTAQEAQELYISNEIIKSFI